MEWNDSEDERRQSSRFSIPLPTLARPSRVFELILRRAFFRYKLNARSFMTVSVAPERNTNQMREAKDGKENIVNLIFFQLAASCPVKHRFHSMPPHLTSRLREPKGPLWEIILLRATLIAHSASFVLVEYIWKYLNPRNESTALLLSSFRLRSSSALRSSSVFFSTCMLMRLLGVV